MTASLRSQRQQERIFSSGASTLEGRDSGMEMHSGTGGIFQCGLETKTPQRYSNVVWTTAPERKQGVDSLFGFEDWYADEGPMW